MSTQQSNELRLCPFCGHGASLRLIPAHEHAIARFMPPASDTWVVECNVCEAGFCADTREAAEAAWNRRPGILAPASDEEAEQIDASVREGGDGRTP